MYIYSERERERESVSPGRLLLEWKPALFASDAGTRTNGHRFLFYIRGYEKLSNYVSTQLRGSPSDARRQLAGDSWPFHQQTAVCGHG